MVDPNPSLQFRPLGIADLQLLSSAGTQVFDDPIDMSRAEEFLIDRHHHIVAALDGDCVVGFVSAVDYLHPDKAHKELWLNEVDVRGDYQGQGVGQGLLDRVFDLGRELGCREAWVLTERDNVPAMMLYQKKGRENSQDVVMFDFDLSE